MLEASGVVSSVNTEDSGGGGNTPFRRYWSPGCANHDGWAYFPTRILNGEKSGTARTSIEVGETCTGHYQSGWYTWKYEPSLNFGGASGVRKTLATIVSRQGPDDPDRPSYFEEVHFTSLYGVTRWSAWRREDPTADTDENARKCALPRKATVGGRDFVPTGCTNLVQIDPLPPSEWRSSLSWPINEAVSGSHNTLGNGDFSAEKLPGWNGVTARVADEKANMFGVRGASCFAQNALSPGAARGRDKLMFGARLWTGGNADQVTVTASVHRNGTWVVVGSQLATLSGAPSLVMATAPAAQNGNKIRITFAAANVATVLRVDDAYASFTFPQLY